MWNYKLPPRLVTEANPRWNELTPKEQRAAVVLGYSREAWCRRNTGDVVEVDDDNDDNQTYAEIIVPWENYDWEGLPPDVQAAYQVLGWSQIAWDEGLGAYTDELLWEDLTPVQRDAAAYLGYSTLLWNSSSENDDGVDETGVEDYPGTEVTDVPGESNTSGGTTSLSGEIFQ